MIKHFEVQGYISTHHKRRIDEHGPEALLIGQVADTPGDLGAGQLPAYRVSCTFDLDVVEV